MSWVRSPYYAWGSGNFRNHSQDWIHIWARPGEKNCRAFDPEEQGFDKEDDFTGGIEMRQDLFDALVLYRYAELLDNPAEMRRAKRAAKEMAGNFGSYAWMKHGDPRRYQRFLDDLNTAAPKGGQ